MTRRPGVGPVLVSLAAHAAVLTPLMAFTRIPAPIEFETIRINLVMAPEPAPAPQVVTRPEPEPVPATARPEPEARVEERPPDPPRREADQPRTERRPDPQPTRPQPAPPAEDPTRPGGDAVNIQTEGRDFPFPDYLANVIEQVHRYFRWTEDSQPRGVIYFEILSDGTARNIRMARSSGNIRFDFALQGAVETAGNRGAFGPLPEAFAAGSLPIQLEVEPPR